MKTLLEYLMFGGISGSALKILENCGGHFLVLDFHSLSLSRLLSLTRPLSLSPLRPCNEFDLALKELGGP